MSAPPTASAWTFCTSRWTTARAAPREGVLFGADACAAEAPTLDEGYGGPAFSDLDASLQEAFEAYLEERGVDAALAEYVVELSIDKEQREYVNWLKRTAAFVKA